MQITPLHTSHLSSDLVAKIIQRQDVPKPARYYSAARLVCKTWRTGCQKALLTALNRMRHNEYGMNYKFSAVFWRQFGKELQCYHDIHTQPLTILPHCPNLHTFRSNLWEISEGDYNKLIVSHPQLTALNINVDRFKNPCPPFPRGLKKLTITKCRPEFYGYIAQAYPEIESLKIRFPERLPSILPQQLKKFSLEISGAITQLSPLHLPLQLENLSLRIPGLANFAGQEWHFLPPTVKKLKLMVSSLAWGFLPPPQVKQFKLHVHSQSALPLILPENLTDLTFYAIGISNQAYFPDGLKKLTLDRDSSALPCLPNTLKQLSLTAPIEKLDSLPPKLKILRLASTALTRLTILPDSMRNMELTCPQLKEIHFPNHLENLQLYEWNFSSLSPLPLYLRTLVLDQSNHISQLPECAGLLHLEEVTINRCASFSSFSFPPHSKRVWLKNLQKLTQLPTKAPVSLHLLDIEGCPIKDLPYFSNNLRTLNITRTLVNLLDLCDVPWHVKVQAFAWLSYAHKYGIAKVYGNLLTG